MSSSFVTHEDLDDPFSALGKGHYVKKQYLKNTKTAFNITAVDGPTLGTFGEELVITIEYIDQVTGELTEGRMSFPLKNKKGEVGPRTQAFLTMQKGLALGKVYDNYYLVGSGTGILISKTPA
jgi:hypothetical protein